MPLAKTEKARLALLDRKSFSPLDRQMLILCDGKRTIKELQDLFNVDVDAWVMTMMERGYVIRLKKRMVEDDPFSLTGTFVPLPASAFPPLQTPDQVHRVVVPIMPTLDQMSVLPVSAEPVMDKPPARASEVGQANPQASARRSLAASKMYMMDILQFVRDETSASIRAGIQTSLDELEMVGHMLEGLRHVHRSAGASYALRVSERLKEILPEVHLPRFQAALDSDGNLDGKAMLQE